MKRTLCYAERVRRKRRREILKIFMYAALFYGVLIWVLSLKTT